MSGFWYTKLMKKDTADAIKLVILFIVGLASFIYGLLLAFFTGAFTGDGFMGMGPSSDDVLTAILLVVIVPFTAFYWMYGIANSPSGQSRRKTPKRRRE